MADKNVVDVQDVSPEWIEEQCKAFEATLLGFTEAMRARFREKAREGRGRWQRAEFAPQLYQAVLAHAASMPLAAGAEADCANFLAFLWRINRENPGNAVRPQPGPRPFMSGYGLKADVELVRLTLDVVAEGLQATAPAIAQKLRDTKPEAVIDELNKAAA